MTAGQSIIISPGFSTQPGSVFIAEIDNTITSCQTPGVQSFKTNPSNTLLINNSIEKNEINGLTVYAYPNPAIDLITVGAVNNNYTAAAFTVTDLSGRVMALYNQPDISGSDIRQIMDISLYATGLYIVTMEVNGQKYSFKFVKE